MEYAEAIAREQVEKDPGASIQHTEMLVNKVCHAQRNASCQAIQDFIKDIGNLVSPQVIKAFQRAISIANNAKLELTEVESTKE